MISLKLGARLWDDRVAVAIIDIVDFLYCTSEFRGYTTRTDREKHDTTLSGISLAALVARRARAYPWRRPSGEDV